MRPEEADGEPRVGEMSARFGIFLMAVDARETGFATQGIVRLCGVVKLQVTRVHGIKAQRTLFAMNFDAQLIHGAGSHLADQNFVAMVSEVSSASTLTGAPSLPGRVG